MANISAFVQGILFAMSLLFDLGIVNAAMMKTGIERGFKPSFMIGFGSSFGDLFYLSLALLGVSFIFEIAFVRIVLWIVGSIVLLFLTYRMLRESWKPAPLQMDGAAAKNKSAAVNFFTGLGLTLSSPTVIVWFALVAGPVVAGMNIASGAPLAFFIAGFFTASMAWSVGIAFVSSRFGLVAGSQMIRVLSFVSALLFLYFAVKVFWNGLQNVL